MTNSLADIVVKATAGPWSYRTAEHDDWGIVRSPNQQGQFYGGIICQARDPEALDEITLAHHRAINTDPWEANAQLIALAPTLATLVLEAREALRTSAAAIDEMFRYYDGGQTRGSYDGKPERAQLRKAGYSARATLAKLESL